MKDDVKERIRQIARRVREARSKKEESAGSSKVLRDKPARRIPVRGSGRVRPTSDDRPARRMPVRGSGRVRPTSDDSVEKIARIKSRISALRQLIRKQSAERVVDDAIVDRNLETSKKDYAVGPSGRVSGGYADGAALEALKQQQLSKANPSLRAEDVRKAFKKALVVAWKRYARNLEKEGNPLKAALYEKMVDLGIKPRSAVRAIEAAFEESSDDFIEQVVDKAEEFSEMEPKELENLEEAVNVSFDLTLLPEGTVDGEWEVEGSGEVEEVAQDIEERLEKGSFRIPRVASAKGDKRSGDVIKQALPGYKVPE